MPWRATSVMAERLRFAERAEREPMAPLCREFGISRTSGYLWKERYREGGAAGLLDRSHGAHSCPHRTSGEIEARILQVRAERGWGARKIRAVLLRQGLPAPAASTIGEILRKHGQSRPQVRHTPVGRFERGSPNELWQMDFKGHFALSGGGRCHPLSLLDDHSRFSLLLQACADQTLHTVQEHLTRVFQCYGLPEAILSDNGSPWGDSQRRYRTRFEIWLMRLQVRPLHGRPLHPQTQGKEERFHRTLQEELLSKQEHASLRLWQESFDAYRQIYNTERPHEALGMQVPAERYRPSARPWPSRLPEMEYPTGAVVRKVQRMGCIYFRGQVFRCVQKAYRGERVALQESERDGEWAVCFGPYRIGVIDLKYPVEES